MDIMASARSGAAVTPSDSTQVLFKALWVGVGGNVAVQFKLGTSVTFLNVPSGVFLPVRVVRVMATNTTATNIIGISW